MPAADSGLDGRGAIPYVRTRMNLLLLLSALFSALAGVGGAVRAPDAVQAVAGTSVTRNAPVAAIRAVTARPVTMLPTLDAVARSVGAPEFAPVAATPIWATRRRE